MTSPIGLQLYSVREAMNQDFNGTVKKIAEMGYVGVEPAGFPGTTPKDAMKLFADLGLKVCGSHTQLPLGEKQAEIVELMAVLGNPPLIVPWQPPELFQSMEGIKSLAEKLNEAQIVAKKNGFRLGYHNHDAEMNLIEGQPALKLLFELTDPEVIFEIDTYWVQTGGINPADLVKEFGKRAPFLHIKDGPCKRGEPMTAVGDGKMEFTPIIEAGKPFTEWVIVEIDACATDMLEAVDKSYQFLVNEGFGHGSK